MENNKKATTKKNHWISLLDNDSLARLREFEEAIEVLNKEEYSEKAVKVTLKYPSGIERIVFIPKSMKLETDQEIVKFYIMNRMGLYFIISESDNAVEVMKSKRIWVSKKRTYQIGKDRVLVEDNFLEYLVQKEM